MPRDTKYVNDAMVWRGDNAPMYNFRNRNTGTATSTDAIATGRSNVGYGRTVLETLQNYSSIINVLYKSIKTNKYLFLHNFYCKFTDLPFR